MGNGLKRTFSAAVKTGGPRLSRKQWEALGSLMIPTPSGINQLHPATAAKLIGLGLVEEREILLRGRFPMRVKTHHQTIAGNLAYCQWAAKQSDGVLPPEGDITP
jgi:hypothetical protein